MDRDKRFEHEVLNKLQTIECLLNEVLNKENQIMASIDDLVKDVTDETTLIDSVSTLIQGLKDQLAAIIAGNLPAPIQAKVDAAFAAAEANKAKLAAALVANTPSA